MPTPHTQEVGQAKSPQKYTHVSRAEDVQPSVVQLQDIETFRAGLKSQQLFNRLKLGNLFQ